jgi:molybdopterin-synthase adenylyltransferase
LICRWPAHLVPEILPVDRYIRQMRYPPLGEPGQQRLCASRVLLVGCGALGTVLASTMVRAGVGLVRIVDRDFVELTNLQRQVLFDEQDVAADLPKAIAAADKLRRVNSTVVVEPIVADVGPDNVLKLAGDVDLILDGTDNFETRMLINDVAVRLGKPWVYGGCIGAEGQTMTILPGGPCLRCLMPEPPPPGATETCDTAGILAPIVAVVASYQACEAIKILSGNSAACSPYLTVFEMWDNRVRQVEVRNLREQADCPVCRRGQFEWLSGERASRTAVLCGRNAVQLSPAGPAAALSLDELAAKLEPLGAVTRNRYLLRFTDGQYTITVFPDGRAIVGGTDDAATARTVFAKYVGN